MRRKVMLKEKSRCCYKTFTGWSVEHKKLLRCERRAAGWSCVSRLTRRHRASFKMQLVCLPLCESRCFAAHPAGKRGFWYHYVPEHFKFYAHQEKKKIKRPNSQVRIALQYCIDNETLFTSCFTPIEQNIFCYFVYLLTFFGLCTVIMQQTSHLLILDGVCERNRGEKMTSLQNKHPL